MSYYLGIEPTGDYSAYSCENGSISFEEMKKYPLGFGEPTDIAYGVISLLSDAARWVTGSVLTIDGGVTLR